MTDTLEREIRIAATPETVFRFLTESDAMAQWMGTRPSSTRATHRGS